MRCGECGAYVSLKNRWLIGYTTAILILCKKCKAVLIVPFSSTSWRRVKLEMKDERA